MRLASITTIVGDVRTSIAARSGAPAVSRQLYAQLGATRFEVVGAIVGLETKRAFVFAQHEVVEGKPRLQSTGDALDQITVTLRFRQQFVDPVAAFADLVSAAKQHLAMPFVFASGDVLGRYVISEIGDTIDKTDATGRITARTVKLSLLEYVEGSPLEVASRARRTSAAAAVASAPKTSKPGATIGGGDPNATPTSKLIRGRP